MNILLFDKSPIISEMIQRNLMRIDPSLDIKTVFDMETVNESVKDIYFDLILLDMDNLDGKFPGFIDLFKKTNPDAVVFLLSSFPSERVFNKFLTSGADSCLDKTTDFEILLKKFEEFLLTDPQQKQLSSL